MVRQNQPPGSTAGAISSLIIGTVVFTIVLVIVGFFSGLKKLFVAVFRQWEKGKLEKIAIGDGSAATTVAANPVANLQNPASMTLLADEKDVVRAADLKRVDLKGAYLSIRYYETRGLAKAKLTISSRVIQKRVGSPVVQLEDLQVESMAKAAMEFRTRAEVLMAGDGSKAELRSVVPITVPDAVAEAPIVEAPTPPVSYPVAQDQEQTTAAPPPPRKKAVSRKQISYRGVLIDAGLAPRTQGDRSFNQYRVLLHDDNLCGELPLWGTDLERVLLESGVKPGDRIEASIVGETEVMIKGKPKPKTIWAISKV